MRGPWWITHRQTWGRTQADGEHWARESMVYAIGKAPFLVAHQAPRYTDNTDAAQAEGIDLIAARMAPWRQKQPRPGTSPQRRVIQRLRPRRLCWDSNSRVGDKHGPDVLAKRIGGQVTLGNRIDNVVSRCMRVVARLVASVNGVPLKSDHRHAVRIKWRVRLWWLKPSKEKP